MAQRPLTYSDWRRLLALTNRQTATPLPTPAPGGGGAPGSRPLFWGPTPLVLFSLGIEKTDKFKPTSSRPRALHLQSYSSVSVWRGTEGGGVDAHRKRHLNQDYPKPGNKRKGAYGCCLDLFVSRCTSEIENCLLRKRATPVGSGTFLKPSSNY